MDCKPSERDDLLWPGVKFLKATETTYTSTFVAVKRAVKSINCDVSLPTKWSLSTSCKVTFPVMREKVERVSEVYDWMGPGWR
ncbi:hypothetical protein RRG08_050816 [Elysia crispata]|uniref:Uncharacterized protein n=1 Tax=Elysia crispata TaxID=231223 RepID=A0AAE1AD94_9GAST|nr:hypothetical protein RRG08_050816 [Elysia crispata]